MNTEDSIDDWGYLLEHIKTTPGVQYPTQPSYHRYLSGWACPVCGAGNSPYSNICPCTGGWVTPVVTC